MREPVYRWDWAWLPIQTVEDPTAKPGHIALVLALRTAEAEFNELDDLDGGNFATGQVYLPVTRSRLLELAGFRDADTLGRYRDDVTRFGYLEFIPRSGVCRPPMRSSRIGPPNSTTTLTPPYRWRSAETPVSAHKPRPCTQPFRWPPNTSGKTTGHANRTETHTRTPPGIRSSATSPTGISASWWDSDETTNYGATATN